MKTEQNKISPKQLRRLALTEGVLIGMIVSVLVKVFTPHSIVDALFDDPAMLRLVFSIALACFMSIFISLFYKVKYSLASFLTIPILYFLSSSAKRLGIPIEYKSALLAANFGLVTYTAVYFILYTSWNRPNPLLKGYLQLAINRDT